MATYCKDCASINLDSAGACLACGCTTSTNWHGLSDAQKQEYRTGEPPEGDTEEAYAVATRPNAKIRWRLMPNVFSSRQAADAFRNSRQRDASIGSHQWLVVPIQLPEQLT